MDREGKIKELAVELGKSVTKQILINQKYTQYNFDWIELRALIGFMYNEIEEQLNKEEIKNVER